MIDPATPLRGLPVAVLDFEATDHPGPDAHVVDAAVVHGQLGEGDPRIAFASLIRPPVPIPERVSTIHGITDADVADAPSFAQVTDAILEACAGRVIVAFNAPADFAFLARELERLERPRPPWPWLDLLVVRKATKTRGRPGRLGEIATEYGVDLDAHGAAGDALVTALLLTPLMRAAWTAGAFRSAEGAQPLRRRGWGDYDDDQDDDKDGPLPPRVETWGAFADWQRSAALWQERNYAEYRRSQGDAHPPRCDWHVLEGVEAPTWAPPARVASCPGCGASVLVRVGRDGTRCYSDVRDGPHVCGGTP